MKRKTRRFRRAKLRKKVLKFTITIGVILFLLTSGFGVYALMKAKNAYDHSQVDLNREGGKSDLREAELTFDDPFSILLLGIENYSSGNKSGLADTQIVLTVDPAASEIHMVTVPRDTRVNIENAGEYSGIHKLNAAYSYGAITIDIKEDFWEENFYDGSKIKFEKGTAHLNGEESLAFVRMRKLAINAVYSREERQRQFLAATIDQAMSAGTIFKIGQITDILGDNVETDLTAKQIYALQKPIA